MGDVRAQLIRACRLSMDPTTDPTTRQQAYEYCESFKASSPDCPAVGLELALLQKGEVEGSISELRYFGLQLLDHCIQHRWNEYGQEQREEMKQTLCGRLLIEGVRLLGLDPTYIYSKMAAVVAQMAKREWPQRWPNLIPDLLNIALINITIGYIVVSFLKTLAEDVIALDSLLEGRRRKELNQGLTASLDLILPFLTNSLQESLAMREYEPETADVMIDAILSAWQAFAGWIALDKLYSSGVLPLLCTALTVEEHRQAAADCLLLVVERKGPKHDRVPLLDLFQQVEVLLSTVPSAVDASGEVDDDSYNFICRLCQVYCSLSACQLCALWHHSQGPVKQAPDSFDGYLYGLLKFTEHDSDAVSSMTLGAWLHLLKHEDARRTDGMLQVQDKLLETLFLRLMIGRSEEDFQGPSAAYNINDFTSMEEYQAFFALYRSKLLEVVRAVGYNCPKLAIEFAGSKLQEVMQVDQSTVDLRLLRNSWDGVAVFWEAVMSAAYPIIAKEIYKPIYKQVFEFLKQCFSAALAWDNSDSLLLVSELTVLGSLLPCLDLCPEGFPLVVKKLFAAMEHRALADQQLLHSEAQKPISSTGLTDGAKVRRKAGNIMIQLCRKPPACFLEGLNYICEVSQSLIAKPEIGEMQRKLLMEALVSSFNSLDDPAQHAQALSMFVGDIVKDWSSETATLMVSTPTMLAQHGNLAEPGVNGDQPARKQLLAWLSSINVMARSTQSRDESTKTMLSGVGGSATGGNGQSFAYTAVIVPALPNLFALVRTLHHFEAELGQLGHGWQLLDLRRSDAYALLSSAMEVASRVMTHDELWLDRAQMWLYTLRENTYSLLQCLAKSGILYENDYPQAFFDCCLQSFATLRLRDFKLFLKHAGVAFLRYLPRHAARLEPLGPLVDTLLVSAQQRMEACLQAQQQGQRVLRDGNSAGLTPEQLEIMNDKLVADTLEVFINMIDQFTADTTLELNQPIEDRNLHVARLGPTATFVLARSESFGAVLSILTTCLSSSTPVAAKKSAVILARLVPALAGFPEYCTPLANTVVAAMLAGLEVYGEHGDCLNALLTLASKCAVYLTQDQAALAAFATVQDFDMDGLEAFVTQVTSGKITNTKTMKSNMRSLLESVIGVNVSKAYKTSAKVLDIPEKLQLMKEAKPEEDPTLNLELIFGDS
eukprot:m.240083 g.240083  ORF g.240083 m.240083 type:complete len:1168 (+) comp17435_c0_seq1:56-3559(+)